MANPMFEEKKVEASGIFEQKKLEELTPSVGTSIGFYLVATAMINGDDGEFMVCNGLQVDLASKTVDEMVANAQPVSFIPKSILQGDIEEGGWNLGQLARLENDIRKGDEYKGKKVRYYHWMIFIQDAGNDILKALKDRVAELEAIAKGNVPGEMAEKQSDAGAPKTKPKL